MRLTRDRARYAAKQRTHRHVKIKSEEGIECPICEPRRNGLMVRQTLLARAHAAEINEALRCSG